MIDILFPFYSLLFIFSFFLFLHAAPTMYEKGQKLVLKYRDFMFLVKDCFGFSLVIRIKIICKEKKIYCE